MTDLKDSLPTIIMLVLALVIGLSMVGMITCLIEAGCCDGHEISGAFTNTTYPTYANKTLSPCLCDAYELGCFDDAIIVYQNNSGSYEAGDDLPDNATVIIGWTYNATTCFLNITNTDLSQWFWVEYWYDQGSAACTLLSLLPLFYIIVILGIAYVVMMKYVKQ